MVGHRLVRENLGKSNASTNNRRSGFRQGQGLTGLTRHTRLGKPNMEGTTRRWIPTREDRKRGQHVFASTRT